MRILYIFKITILSPIAKAMAMQCHFPSRIMVQTRRMVWGSLPGIVEGSPKCL